jgi:hypothetical protein
MFLFEAQINNCGLFVSLSAYQGNKNMFFSNRIRKLVTLMKKKMVQRQTLSFVGSVGLEKSLEVAEKLPICPAPKNGDFFYRFLVEIFFTSP